MLDIVVGLNVEKFDDIHMINLLHNLFFLLVVMCVFLLNSVNGHHFPLIGSQTTNSTALLLSASPGSFALLGGRGGPEGGELLGNASVQFFLKR